MEKLLKIVDGPMKGAEVALVAGTRIKVGSGDGCDIVIADSALAEQAFELDVSERAVTLVTPAGLTSELQDFEIRDFGSTAIAIGPAEGKWGELWRKPAEDAPAAAPAQAHEAPTQPPAGKPEEEAAPLPAGPEPARRRRYGCLWLIIVLLLLLLALLWYFRVPARGYARKALHFVNRNIPAATETSEPEVQRTEAEAAYETPAQIVSLTEIASEHGLSLQDRDGVIYLCGNLKRRTEKMAIRAMALAIDRGVKFDLSDDQSLRTAAENTLYLVSGGSLKVAEATNRVVALSGEVTDPATLEKVLRALGDDVPQLATCDTSAVRLSGRVVASAGDGAETAQDATAADAKIQEVKVEKARNFPVAGILMAPYPCVVLTDGSRCLEGTVISGYTLRKISAEELVFESAGQEIVWRP